MMKRVLVSAAILMAASVPAFANAGKETRSVDRARCIEIVVDHPDGTSDSERKCHTDADGTR